MIYAIAIFHGFLIFFAIITSIPTAEDKAKEFIRKTIEEVEEKEE